MCCKFIAILHCDDEEEENFVSLHLLCVASIFKVPHHSQTINTVDGLVAPVFYTSLISILGCV